MTGVERQWLVVACLALRFGALAVLVDLLRLALLRVLVGVAASYGVAVAVV